MSDMPERRTPENDPRQDPRPDMAGHPRPAQTVQPAQPSPPARAAQPAQMDLWPDMTGIHQRFDEIQSEFIEDPKSAVTKAERLIDEAIDQMAKSMHERMRSMHHDIEGKDGDTETLRQTMRSYRAWIDSVGTHRAA